MSQMYFKKISVRENNKILQQKIKIKKSYVVFSISNCGSGGGGGGGLQINCVYMYE